MDWIVLVAAMVVTQFLPGAPKQDWATVLGAFDLIRAQAYEQGRPELLERVYPSGSELLADDSRMLNSYGARGIHVDDLRMRVISASLLDRSRNRVRLDVVDQLSLTRVHLPDGSVRDLPRDQPTRRTVELSLTDEGWRISSVSLRQ